MYHCSLEALPITDCLFVFSCLLIPACLFAFYCLHLKKSNHWRGWEKAQLFILLVDSLAYFHSLATLIARIRWHQMKYKGTIFMTKTKCNLFGVRTWDFSEEKLIFSVLVLLETLSSSSTSWEFFYRLSFASATSAITIDRLISTQGLKCEHPVQCKYAHRSFLQS